MLAAMATLARVGVASYLVGEGLAVRAGDGGGTSFGSSCCAFWNIWFASAVAPVSRRISPRLK